MHVKSLLRPHVSLAYESRRVSEACQVWDPRPTPPAPAQPQAGPLAVGGGRCRGRPGAAPAVRIGQAARGGLHRASRRSGLYWLGSCRGHEFSGAEHEWRRSLESAARAQKRESLPRASQGLRCHEAAAQGAQAGGLARQADPGPGLLLRRLLSAGRPAPTPERRRLGLPRGRDPPGGTMRVARWLTGLLCQLSFLLTRSWEVHFHPRQGRKPSSAFCGEMGGRAD